MQSNSVACLTRCNLTEEQQPNEDKQWRQERECVFENKAEKGRRTDFLMVGDGFDHEIRTVAEVGVCAEENGGDADGNQIDIESVVPEQESGLNLLGPYFARSQIAGVIFLKRFNRMLNGLGMRQIEAGSAIGSILN